MYLSLKVSNNLKGLAAAFFEVEAEKRRGVFEPLTMVTQVEGINNWLRLQIAEHFGIAANIEFFTPNQLINKVFFALGGKFQQPLPAESVAWIVYAILGEENFINRYASTAAYYTTPNGFDDLKRYGLAEKIADLFDQYQVYRPQMIENWNIGKSATGSDKVFGDEAWQMHIWKRAAAIAGDAFPDKTKQRRFILDALEKPGAKEALTAKIKDINIFALSIITSFHLQIFFEPSRQIPVNFYLLNPSPEYFWVDEKSGREIARTPLQLRQSFSEGNELLSELGRVQRDTYQLLFSFDSFTNAYEAVNITEKGSDTLLHKVQSEVLASLNNDARSEISQQMLQDGSMAINACYTEAGEVGALYNFLVDTVDKNPGTITERDILVLMPQPEQYLPFIRAVFDNAPYKFRYNISGVSANDGASMLDALTSILKLNEDGFTAEAVFSLLASPLIKEKFGLTDIASLRSIVRGAGVRYGIDNSRLLETHFVSWRYGLQRIMYGICISGEPLVGEGSNSFYPIDSVEGLSTTEVVHFVRFVELLIEHLEERKKWKSISGWTAFVEKTVNDFISINTESYPDEQQSLSEMLADLNASGAVFQEPISYAVVQASLAARLQSLQEKRVHWGAGITFSPIIPMRSIPYKIIALLGLNNDAFPRRDTEVTFDLMRQFPQKGDRNRKENDKNLFLEILLAAGDYFYVSYIGRNAQDNSVIPPSSVIDTLLSYLQVKASSDFSVESDFVLQQPLHAHSAKYNIAGGKLKSYLLNNPPALNFINEQKLILAPIENAISIEDIKKFFSNSIQFYYNKVLQVYYGNIDSALIEEQEVFELDKLSESILTNAMMELPDAETGAFIEKQKRYGNIPLANKGSVLVQQMQQDLADAKDVFLFLKDKSVAKAMFGEAKIGDAKMYGTIGNIYGEKVINVCKSKKGFKHLQNLYVDYLFAVACGFASEGWLINIGEAAIKLKQVDTNRAIKKLVDLLSIYRNGVQAMQPYAAELYTENRTEAKYNKAIMDAYNEYIILQASEGFFVTRFEDFDAIASHFDDIKDNG